MIIYVYDKISYEDNHNNEGFGIMRINCNRIVG